MTHLNGEDIERFVDGLIDEDERERFLTHFSRCDDCFEAYADILNLVEKEKKETPGTGFDIRKKIAAFNYSLSLVLAPLLRPKVYAPALAVLIILLLILAPFKKQPLDDTALTEKLQYIEESIMKLEATQPYALFPAASKINAAVRIGIFAEDLDTVSGVPQKKQLKETLTGLLQEQLKIIFEHKEPPPAENTEQWLKQLAGRLKQEGLDGPYHFGRFVEQGVLSTFDRKKKGLKKKELEKQLRIVRQYNLPEGIETRLNKLKTSPGGPESLDIWIEIKGVFL
jgi:hypothetical protein